MTPLFQIIAEGKDITALIKDRLIRLTVTDKAGFSSDTASIVLDDRDSRLALPRKGAELEIHMGHSGIGLSPMGIFTVDSVSISGPPDTLTLSAKAAEMGGHLKEKRVASYDSITMGDLVATIAARHRLTPKVDPFLAEIRRSHLDQANESDLHLLTRVAKEINAVAKAAHGYLIFVPKGKAKSASGRDLKPVEVKKEDLSSWSFSFPDRAQYGSVIAVWRNEEAAKDMEVKAGDGEPVLRLPKHYADQAEAETAAKARFKKVQQEKATGSLSLAVGNPFVLAETPITLPDMRPEVAQAKWMVAEVRHTISAGYLLTIDIARAPVLNTSF